MSGVFGLFGGTPSDVERVRAASATVDWRGEPMVIAERGATVGTYVRTPEDQPSRVGSSVLVADARYDGVVPGTAAARAASGAGSLALHQILAGGRPDDLMGLAADFAAAILAHGGLRLVRDAFGMRPLFWARRGIDVAFASDAEFLWALGFGEGVLDRESVARYLAGGAPRSDRSAFVGISKVPPGTWVSFTPDGGTERGRWFEPSSIRPERRTFAEASSDVADSVTAAVLSRVKGRRAGITLSSGRDSGSVAAAAARANVRLSCMTFSFGPEVGPTEEEGARTLAEALGHTWRALPVPSTTTTMDLDALPKEAGTPLALTAFPLVFAVLRAAEEEGVEVMLNGDGGEPLFSAAPVSVWEAARHGHPRLALAAARAYNRRWLYPYPVVAKAAIRAVLPRRVLALRERLRSAPPWVANMPRHELDLVTTAQTSREHLCHALEGMEDADGIQRAHARRGMEYASPLLDMRVVTAVLRTPSRFRLPVPEPKPLLSSLLGEAASSREKHVFASFFRCLADGLQRDFPRLFEASSMTATLGYVMPRELRRALDPGNRVAALPLVPVEVWLQAREEMDGGRR